MNSACSSLVGHMPPSVPQDYTAMFVEVTNKNKYKKIIDKDIGRMNTEVCGVTRARWVQVIPIIMMIAGGLIIGAGMGSGLSIFFCTEHLASMAPLFTGVLGGVTVFALGYCTLEAQKPIYCRLGSQKYQAELKCCICQAKNLSALFDHLKRECGQSVIEKERVENPPAHDKAAQALASIVVDYGLLGEGDATKYQAIADALVQYSACYQKLQQEQRLFSQSPSIESIQHQNTSNLTVLKRAYDTNYESLNQAFTMALASMASEQKE